MSVGGGKIVEIASFVTKSKNLQPTFFSRAVSQKRVWLSIKEWLGLIDVNPERWYEAPTVHEWWRCFVQNNGQSKKAMPSLAMLVSWEVWKERNTCVFRNHHSTVDMVTTRVKREMALWASAGVKALGNVMSRE
jgi:hypothetical protein